MNLRVLEVDLGNGSGRVTHWDGGAAPGPVALASTLPADALVVGVGPLGSLDVPGANRLVFAGRSPLWRGFFVSTVGSAGAPMRQLEIDALVLRGRAPETCALVVGRDGAFRLHPLDVDRHWSAGSPGGVYGLLGALLHAGLTACPNPRVLATGPAAAHTRMGALASSVPRRGQPLVLDTWAGRGGFGSRLLQQHGLAALVFDAPADAGRAPRVATAGKPERGEVRKATEKYRYHPLLATGGTLGSNLTTLREKLLALNDRSMYWPAEIRATLHERLIEGHYLAQFNEQTRRGKRGRDCGETCPAVCKKVSGTFKKDYQPYAAMGPHIGVFDQSAAEHAADTADALGFDAIEAGALAGWALDCVDAGLLAPDDVALPDVPHWNIDAFDPVADSLHNAHLAAHLLSAVASDAEAPPVVVAMRDGIRAAAAEAGGEARDRASYCALGTEGSIAPNHYWTPGIIAGVPIPGKYYTDYSLEYCEPDELGRRSAERFVRELALDNLGMCRFQREWAEDRLPDLLAEQNPDIEASAVWPAHTQLAATLHALNEPVFWETRRTRDRLITYLRETVHDEPTNTAAASWLTRLESAELPTCHTWWNAFRQGFTARLNQD